MKELICSTLLLFWLNATMHSQPCTPAGDQTTFGSNNTWIGYAYDNTDFTNYRSYFNEGITTNPDFDESFGGDNVLFPTNGCSVQTETFSVRFKLRKAFTNGVYDFTVGGDDGFRLSLDGGNTWPVNRWNDQGYTTTTYSTTLNGTYDLILEYYENSGGNRISFNVAVGCMGTENTAVYGTNNIWKGYVYDDMNFTNYKGMVTEGTATDIAFDQNFGGSNVLYSTSSCAVQTETFSVRYRLTKNFPNGNYTFTAGADDGFRLSLDGGNTWIIDRFWDQSYNTASASVNLNGIHNVVFEFYENGGDNRVSLSLQSNIILSINLLSFSGQKTGNNVMLTWDISSDSDPLSFTVERSTDARLFNDLQLIPAANAAIVSNSRHYDYTDAAPLSGNLYYRLKMVDRQGNISYSNIIAFGVAVNPGELTLYPTVINDNIVYCKSGKTITKGVIQLSDANGRIVYSQIVGKIDRGQTVSIYLKAGNTVKGYYFLTVLDGDQRLITKKVIM